MLQYAGNAHSNILDSIESLLPDGMEDETMPVDSLRKEIASVSAWKATPAPRAAYVPGWHGISELGY